MTLRSSFAAALQLLRSQKGLTQADISTHVAQSHVSQLETAKTTATVDVSYELANALGVKPVSLLTLAVACHQKCTAREALLECLAELEELDLADSELSDELRPRKTTSMIEAERKRKAVHELKAQGLTQAEAGRQLGLPKATLRRLWNQSLSK
ncbi:helix-turn-helix domain-containing protein [Pseudomonas sp. ES1]|uniref:helix-turn-helix domain-containing protein n=1 Tax=Pseudomonas sp. ES1 TaxID=3424775 RepID=UPI003D352318